MAYYVDASGNVVTYDPVTGQTVRDDPGNQTGGVGQGGNGGLQVGSGGGLGSTGGIPQPPTTGITVQGIQPRVTPPPQPPPNVVTPRAAPQPDSGGVGLSPTDPAYWLALGNSPPWFTAGYGDFASWSRAVGDKNAAAATKAAADLAYTQAQTANVGATNGQGAASSAAQLAQQQRQWQETFDFNKADSIQKASAADKALAQQKELETQKLGLRPETLLRYLYALRGQQTPQSLGGVASSPASSSGLGVGAGGGGGAAGTASLNLPGENFAPPINLTGTAVPGTRVMPNVTPLMQTNPTPQAPSGTGTLTSDTQALAAGVTGFGPAPALNDLLRNANNGVQPFVGNDVSRAIGTKYTNALGQTIGIGGGDSRPWQPYDAANPYGAAPGSAAETASKEAGRAREDENRRNEMAFAKGGVISEPIIGIGRDSGTIYNLGEQAPGRPETIVPEGDTLAEAKKKTGVVDGGDGHAPFIGQDDNIDLLVNAINQAFGTVPRPPSNPNQPIPNAMRMAPPIQAGPMPMRGSDWPGETGAYGTGPDMTERSYATGGQLGYSMDYNPQVFNPPELSGLVSRGFGSTGGALPPQVGMLTGGGQSLIPSAQSMSKALPSELGLYSDFLTTEAGVPSDDVFSLAKRLAPQITGVRTPSYAS